MHGADIEKIKREYKIDGEILDFSSNINPVMPDMIGDLIVKSIDNMSCYPDIEYVDLRSSISDYLNGQRNESSCLKTNYEHIAVGNGATELIFLITRLIKGKLAIVSPTFGEYARAARINGLDFEEVSFEYLLENIYRYDNVFICNPNNPDGKIRDLENLISSTNNISSKENPINIFIDETFIEFTDNHKKYTALNYGCSNVFVFRALTKFFGMPGLRLGYLHSNDREFIKQLNQIKEPWTVNSFAEAVGRQVLKDDKFIEYTRKYYESERKYIYSKLSKIKEIEVFQTQTAFFLIRIKNSIKSSQLKEKMLLKYGILIRDASNFTGLDDTYIRIAIKDRQKNEKIIRALSDVFK